MINKKNYNFIIIVVFFIFIMIIGFITSTGDKLLFGDKIINPGDVDGNGKIGVNDYIMIRRHLLSLEILKEDNLTAGDVDGDNKISAKDYIKIRKIILNLIPNPTPIVESTPTSQSTITKKGKIHFLYVGDADCIILEIDGHYAMVDSGLPYEAQKKYHPDIISPVSYLNALGVKHLDFLLATHPDPDHIGGFSDIANTSLIDQNTKFYYFEQKEGNANLKNLKKLLQAKNVNFINLADTNVAKNNRKFKFGSTDNYFEIELMNLYNRASNEGTGNYNKDSIVAYLTYNGKHGTLFTGDLESQDEYRMADNNEFSNKSIDVLKVAHHSWQSSTTMKFVTIKEIHPKIAIVSSSVVLDDISTSIYYLQNKYNTKFYLTGDNRNNESIIIEYGDSLKVSTKKTTAVKEIAKYKVVKSNGKWQQLQNGIYFYLNNSNDLNSIFYDRFVTDNNNKYYLGIGGNMMTGWVEIKYNGKVNLYYFGRDGKMVTGWCQAESISPYNNSIPKDYYTYNLWMYSHENVTIPEGWYQYTDSWANGKNWFYFDDSGAMVTEWQKLSYNGNVNWYYFGTNGIMRKGWQKLSYNGSLHWYFFEDSGAMLSNTTRILNGVNYTFDSSGICTTKPECNV